MPTAQPAQYRSLKSLKDEIRAQIWPGTEAENLVEAHNLHFLEGLGQIQKWVDGVNDDNCNVVEFEKTYHKLGMTMCSCPNGVVHYVYTIRRRRHTAEFDWSVPVYYRQVEWPEPEMWGSRLKKHVIPFKERAGQLPMGIMHAHHGTDLKFGRSHTGIYSIYRNNLYIAPWIQSDEVVVIEWTGVKPVTSWTDADLVPADPDFKHALKLYVQYAHERDYGDYRIAETIHNTADHSGSFDEALADLMYYDREKTRVRDEAPHVRRHRHSLISRISPAGPQDELSSFQKGFSPELDIPEEMIIAHIGNNGVFSPSSDAVAEIVKASNPHMILSTGGNVSNDPVSGLPITYDLAIGRNFADFLWPYSGAYTRDLSAPEYNKFWPSIDTADFDNSNLHPFRKFFPLPNDRRYYQLDRGLVSFFILDSSPQAPDGIDANSQQAEWLRLALLLSPARWKIVVLSNPPNSVDLVNQQSALQWPFDQWGADLVLSGSSDLSYERYWINGVAYIVNGLGGAALPVYPGDTTAASFYYPGTTLGSGLITISKCRLTYQFGDVNGNVIDSLELDAGICDVRKHFVPPPPVSVSQDKTGPWTNPNGNVYPDDRSKAAWYYQDPPSLLNQWLWSVQAQQWQQTSGPAT